MTAYCDDPDWLRDGEASGHLLADSLDELHAVAEKIQLTRHYFMGGCLTPHYQLPARMYALAAEAGVERLSRKDFLRKVTQVGDRLARDQAGSGVRAADRPVRRKRPKIGETRQLFG